MEVSSDFNTTLAVDAQPTDIPHSAAESLQEYRLQQQQKAQALFAKYGLGLVERHQTLVGKPATSDIQWVETVVRVRTHRECHHCHTSFGTSKTCANCSHVRCKRCPRWPPKQGTTLIDAMASTDSSFQAGDFKQAGAIPTAEDFQHQQNVEQMELDQGTISSEPAQAQTAFIQPEIDPGEQSDRLRKKQLSKVHQRRGADVVYRSPQFRVRRLCHRCDTVFRGRATECESCGHQRCPDCPRNPTKFAKFPEGTGYPGDTPEPEPTYPALERVWRKPRMRVRWNCHECNAVFANSNDKSCTNCKHSRCDLCVRGPFHKAQRQPSAEVLRGLEGKLVGLKLRPGGDAVATNDKSAGEGL